MPRKIGDRRTQKRISLNGEVVLKIVVSNGNTVDAMVENITANGMQFGCSESLDEGEKFTAMVAGQKVELEVVWCKNHEQYRGLQCCAARVADSSNLIELVLDNENNAQDDRGPGDWPVIDLDRSRCS